MNKNIKELFDKIYDCLSDKVYIQCRYEDEHGYYNGEMYTIDEETCNILEVTIDKLYKLLED